MPYNMNNGAYYSPFNNPYLQPNQMASYQPQSFAQPNQAMGMQWVDGEAGAKAFQMPAGWPSGSPIALWDINDQVFYLKSMNQMGMPNPLQKGRYIMEEQKSMQMLPANQVSGAPESTNNYATKDDIESLKNELRELLKNQNGSNRVQNGDNRGGNR